MTRSTFLLLASLTLSSCYTPAHNFRTMSEAELAAYNAGVSPADRISCREERRTGSHLKSRVCLTQREFQLRELGAVSDANSANVGNGASVQVR